MTKAGKTPPDGPGHRREAARREGRDTDVEPFHIQACRRPPGKPVVGIGIIKSEMTPVALQNPESPPVEIETGPRFDFIPSSPIGNSTSIPESNPPVLAC